MPMHADLEGAVDARELALLFAELTSAGASYEVLELAVTGAPTETSRLRLRLRVSAPDAARLDAALAHLAARGLRADDAPDASAHADATTAPAPRDGVFPEGFYATTNHATDVRVDGAWRAVERPEMDCAVAVDPSGARAFTVAMSEVRAGTPIVIGHQGVRVVAAAGPGGEGTSAREEFAFMGASSSSERLASAEAARVADLLRATRRDGKKILWVCGPAVIHTGAGVALARLVARGWVDVLFAGNGFATHDLERALYGTSLGVSSTTGRGVDGGHAHHLRAINLVRAHGSIALAVNAGAVTSGVVYELVTRGIPFVLGGSVRDDGPLPDTVTDVLEAQRRMRALLPGVGACLVVASMLHGIATGNLLPADVPLLCIDIHPATVTKLVDRGSHQSAGLVTDVGLFLAALDAALA